MFSQLSWKLTCPSDLLSPLLLELELEAWERYLACVDAWIQIPAFVVVQMVLLTIEPSL